MKKNGWIRAHTPPRSTSNINSYINKLIHAVTLVQTWTFKFSRVYNSPNTAYYLSFNLIQYVTHNLNWRFIGRKSSRPWVRWRMLCLKSYNQRHNRAGSDCSELYQKNTILTYLPIRYPRAPISSRGIRRLAPSCSNPPPS